MRNKVDCYFNVFFRSMLTYQLNDMQEARNYNYLILILMIVFLCSFCLCLVTAAETSRNDLYRKQFQKAAHFRHIH